MFGGSISSSLDCSTEQWLTGFCEGDGSLGAYVHHVGVHDYSRVLLDIDQKDRSVLDYIDSVTDGGLFYGPNRGDVWKLRYNHKKCIPLLEIFSRCVVGNHFLGRLNASLEVLGHPQTVRHSPTIDWFVGFWDAEGTSDDTPSIFLDQKERDVLDEVQRMLGGGVLMYGKWGVHRWHISGSAARVLYPGIASRSHCTAKIERLCENFEGPTYYEKHKEERDECSRQYYETHRDERLDYMRRHDEAHRVEHKEASHRSYGRRRAVSAYVDAHPEKVEEIRQQNSSEVGE